MSGESSNACACWDLTMPTVEEDTETREKLIEFFENYCKNYAFQKEKGEESGFVHYQIRFSLKVKERKTGLKKKLANAEFLFHDNALRQTSNANKDNKFYVLKEDTRIEGPWTDKDKEEKIYIPRQLRDIELYPWQKQVIASKDVFDTRTINLIYSELGNEGKSTLASYVEVHKIGTEIDFANDYLSVMRMAHCQENRGLYIIDLPRAIGKERLLGLFSGIESLKNGKSFDDRYKFDKTIKDCPAIWVFTNHIPRQDLLSKDRWKFWKVLYDKTMVEFYPFLVQPDCT